MWEGMRGRGGYTGWTKLIKEKTLRKEKLEIWKEEGLRLGGVNEDRKDHGFGLGTIRNGGEQLS